MVERNTRIISCFIGGCLLLSRSFAETRTDELPRLPGTTLLTGRSSVLLGNDSQFLAVTTTNRTWKLLPEAEQPRTGDGTPVHSSISPDGKMVATVRLKSVNPSRVALATFSLPEGAWTEYAEAAHAEAAHIEAVAISPDKSKLAYVSNDKEGTPPCLHILDVRSRADQTIGPASIYGRPSWSPGGERVAYQVDLPQPSGEYRYEAAIDVFEMATRLTTRLTVGQNPAWSPSGEWIAFLDYSGNAQRTTTCEAIRPDGSGTQSLYTIPLGRSRSGQRHFVQAPVWSPDSTTLLLNEPVDFESDSISYPFKVYSLNFSNHKLTVKFKNVAPILGWAR